MPKFKYNPGDKIGPYQIQMVERIKKKDDNKHWICSFICPYCNKIFETQLDNIVQGDTKSCGCKTIELLKNKQKRTAKIQGQRFGKLIVLEETEERRNTFVVWKCKCDCGNISYVTTTNLTSGQVQSCGRCKTSRGEEKVKEVLDKLKITYKQQYTFKDCINPNTGYLLRFDFYLPDYNCCIEYDGIQHFKYYNTGWSTKENYEKTIYRDSIKNKYCIDNDIKLIRIPYTKFKYITQKYIEELINNNDTL